MIRIISAIKKYLKLIFNDIKSILLFNEDDYFKSKSICETEKSIEFANNYYNEGNYYNEDGYNSYKKFD